MAARPVPARPPTPRATPAASPKVKQPPVTSSRDPADRDGLRSQFNKGPVNDEQTRSAVDTTKGQAVKPNAPKAPAPDAVDVRASASQKLDKAVDTPGRDPASRTDLRSQFAQKSVSDSPAAKVFEEAKGATAGPPMPTGAGPGLGEGIDSASKSMARSLWESSPVKNPMAAIRELGKIAGPAMAYDILDHLGVFDADQAAGPAVDSGFGNANWKAGSMAPTAGQASSSRLDSTGLGSAPQSEDLMPPDKIATSKLPPFTPPTGDALDVRAAAQASQPDAVDVRAGAVAKTAKTSKGDTLNTSKDAGPTQAPASQASGGVQTKGGFFPIYSHDSPDAQDFEKTYGAAKSSGAQDFKWQGRDYNTK